MIIAKHRNGPIGKVALTFLPKYPRFANLVPRPAPRRGAADERGRLTCCGACRAAQESARRLPLRRVRRQRLDPRRGDQRRAPCRCRDRAQPGRGSRRHAAPASRSASSTSRSTASRSSSSTLVLRHVRASSPRSTSNVEAGRGLWFDGPVGTGKTSLAMLVAKAARDAGRSVRRSTRCRACSPRSSDTFDGDSERLLPGALPPPLHGGPARARRPRRREADRVGARAALLDRQRALAGPALDHRHDQHPRPRPRRDPGARSAPSIGELRRRRQNGRGRARPRGS